MTKIYIYNPESNGGAYRGAGRIVQILKENLISSHPESTSRQNERSNANEIQFISDLHQVNYDSTLFILSWQPFQPPRLFQPFAMHQILMIYDVIPLKYSSHFPIGIKGTINLWRNKRVLKHFDKIITISEHSKKDIARYLNVSGEKIVVIYPALSKIFTSSVIARIRQPTEMKQSQANKNKIAAPSARNDKHSALYPLPSNFCLYVGDVNWNKNLVNLAKAIKKTDLPCVFVGKPFDSSKINSLQLNHPWMAEFKQFLEEVDNDKRFIFLGYVEDRELVELYQKAVCNVLVSCDEGFGYSYAEAASQKCPSVLSNTDIFHETAGNTALFANPDNPDDIAEKIMELSTNEKKRNDLGKKAYENVIKMYSPDTFTRQLESIFVE